MPGSRDISDTQASCPDRVLLTVGAPGPISKQQEYRFTPAVDPFDDQTAIRRTGRTQEMSHKGRATLTSGRGRERRRGLTVTVT